MTFADLDAISQVGTRVDRFFYQSRAKDPGTPECELCTSCQPLEPILTLLCSPTAFPAKLDGTSGHLIITYGPQSPPTLSFVPLKSPFEKPSFDKPVADLVEVKKRGVSFKVLARVQPKLILSLAGLHRSRRTRMGRFHQPTRHGTRA